MTFFNFKPQYLILSFYMAIILILINANLNFADVNDYCSKGGKGCTYQCNKCPTGLQTSQNGTCCPSYYQCPTWYAKGLQALDCTNRGVTSYEATCSACICTNN